MVEHGAKYRIALLTYESKGLPSRPHVRQIFASGSFQDVEGLGRRSTRDATRRTDGGRFVRLGSLLGIVPSSPRSEQPLGQ